MTDILINSYERAAFTGKTGSGKTYAARELLKPTRRLIVIDPKMQLIGDRKWRLEAPTREAVKALRDGEFARIAYWQPPAIDDDGFPVWDSIFNDAWEIQDVVIWIDEMYMVAKNGRLSFPLRRLYTIGRSLGIGVWAATQRPAWVPIEMFSEAEWGFTFSLQIAKDRKLVAANLGFDALEQPIRDIHGFWVTNQTWPDPLYFRQLDARAEIDMADEAERVNDIMRSGAVR
jgi:hypothetical protein